MAADGDGEPEAWNNQEAHGDARIRIKLGAGGDHAAEVLDGRDHDDTVAGGKLASRRASVGEMIDMAVAVPPEKQEQQLKQQRSEGEAGEDSL